MRAVGCVAAVLASGCFLVGPPIPIGGGGKSPAQLQRQGIGKLLPAQLTATRRWTGEVRVAKLRVWADAEHRAQNVRWQHGFDEQLDHVNQVLIPMLGVRLEAEYRSWEHHAPSTTLAEHLEALAGQDPGEDVVWVVGLTSSLSLVSPTFDQLGVARVGGRHLVVRGHADLAERKGLERAFPDLSSEEREQVLEARRRHKTAALLLHELAHSLGALHEAEAEAIMSAGYSHRAASIGHGNRALMQITLEDRLKPPAQRDGRATLEQLLAALEDERGGWSPDDRAEAIARLRAELGAQPAAGTARWVPPAVAAQLGRAQQLLAGGDHRGAWAVLEPLVAAYPAHAEIRTLGCKIELARGGARDAKAIATCDRAVQLSAGAEPAIAFASARAAAGDAAGARATLVAAEARIASLPPARAAGEWLALAGHYRTLGALTWAEDALARAVAAGGADPKIAQWCATTRVRYGIPRDGARWKLVPEDDAAAVTAVRGVLDLVYEDKLAAAERAAAAAERRWPALPGLLAVRCDLEIRRGALAAARRLCTRAIASGGSSSWALYLLGILELRDPGRSATAAGIARLGEAIALDPDLGQAWRALAKALRRAGDTVRLDQLGRDYQARFGSRLPP